MNDQLDELQKAYLVLQENCGIKVGDTVKVLRKAETDECGWDNSWVQSMDEFIGKDCKVVSMENTGIDITCDGVECGSRGFPFFVLEKVTHDAISSKGVATDPTIPLRDQFASAALTGLASATDEFGTWTTDPDAAKAAYRYADAMLKAREES